MKSKLGVKPIALFALVFVLGGAAGAATTWAVAVRKLHATMRHPSGKARAKFRLEAMRHRLDLDDEQMAKLEVIFEESNRERDDAIRECRPALDQVRDETGQRVDAVLTPEQREKHAEFRKRMRDRFGRRPPPSAAPSTPASP